jgi:hypothetical protein
LLPLTPLRFALDFGFQRGNSLLEQFSVWRQLKLPVMIKGAH